MKANALLILYFIGLGAIITFGGCAPAPYRRLCTQDTCFIYHDRESIGRHCAKGMKRWDSGKKRQEGDPLPLACSKYYPNRKGRQFSVFLTDGMLDKESSMVHELCHIYEYRTKRNEHKRCHGFGAQDYKTKTRVR